MTTTAPPAVATPDAATSSIPPTDGPPTAGPGDVPTGPALANHSPHAAPGGILGRLRVAWATVRSTVGRVLGVVSPFGWAVIFLMAVAWTVGLTLRWHETVVLAVAVTVALLAAVMFVVGRLRYTVELDVAAKRVVVGDRAVGRLVIRNDSPRTMTPTVMELRVGQGTATFRVPRLRPGAEHEEIFAVPTHRRAVIPLGPVRSVRADPLGLLRRELVWTEPEELFVHPRTTMLTGSSVGLLRDLEGRVTSIIADSDVSFHALRDYVAGDDRRHIHWRSTARTGQLMVRQFEETRRSKIAVILSTRAQDYAGAEEFELAVSVCASLGLQAIREDGGLTVLVHDGRIRGDHRTRLLDDLTRVEASPARTSLADVARVAATAVADASVVAVVLGSAATPSDLRATAVRLPVDARLFGVRCVPGESVSRSRVADMQVLTLGDLAGLAGAMRRMDD